MVLTPVATSALWKKTLNRTSRDLKAVEALMKSKSLTQDVAINNPTSLLGTRTHQDSKATAMIFKDTSLIVATINKLTYSFTL